jgi:cytochrome P450 family 110
MSSGGIEAELPQGPRLSAKETTFRWLGDPFGLLEECARDLGERFTLEFVRFGKHVVVAHPEDVRAVFAADPEVLLAGRGNALLAPILGRHSLLLADGTAHAEKRAMLVHAFRADRARDYARLVVAATRRATARWDEGAVASVHETALAISREVVLRAVLGLAESETAGAAGLVERLMALVGTNAPFADDPRGGRMTARLLAVRGALVEALSEVVAQRRRSGRSGDNDVLSLLLGARSAAGDSLDDEEIHDQLVTMILAGHETTASAISWAVVALLESEAVCDRLTAEIDDAGAACGDEALASLPYLQATCLETLRLFPVVPVVSREVRRPLRMRERWLPAGVFVTPCAYLAHRRADSFPEPAAFEPARFLGRRYPAHVYFPFGGGTRRCLGMGFALLEMQIVLGMLLRHFRLRGGTHRRARPLRRAVTIVPSGGARVVVEQRRSAGERQAWLRA